MWGCGAMLGAGSAAEQSGFTRCPGHDGQGVHANGGQGTQRIIHKAVSCHPAQAAEAAAGELNGKVPAVAGASVARVQVAVVLYPQAAGRQGRLQHGVEVVGRHVLVSGLKLIDAELMQKRSPVGVGPSLKTWPRWLPHCLQRTSTRTMPWLASRTRSTTVLLIGWL